MKKMFCLLLAILMIIGMMLTGCGSNAADQQDQDVVIDQIQEDHNTNGSTNNSPTENGQYIKNGKVNYFDLLLIRYEGTNGAGDILVGHDGLAVNALCQEITARNPEISKATIKDMISHVVVIDNIIYPNNQEGSLRNGDTVTIETRIQQEYLDMWNEQLNDIELVIETPYIVTVEGLDKN